MAIGIYRFTTALLFVSIDLDGYPDTFDKKHMTHAFLVFSYLNTHII